MTNKKFHVNLAVLVTGMMAFLGVLIETAMNVTFPTLMKEFSISTDQVQWVTTIYLLVISIIVPLSSFLLKNVSKRKLFSAASLFFITGVLIDSFAFNYLLLLSGRVLQGVATGISLPLMFNIILTMVPVEKRGLMVGVGNLTTSIAPALGPTYGGWLTTHMHWSYIYKLLVPILVISTIIGLVAIPEEKVVKTAQLNMKAVVSLSVTFIGGIVFFSYLGQMVSWIGLIVSLICGSLFYQFNKTNALLNLTILKKASFSVYLFAFLVFQAVLLGVSFILPNFMQIVREVSATDAGMMMFPGALIGAVFAPISGAILDKIGFKKPIGYGMLVAIGGWVSLILAVNSQSSLWIVASHVIYMIGLGLSYSNVMAVGLSSIDDQLKDDGNAIFSTLQQFVGGVSTSLVASVVGYFQVNSADYQNGTLKGATVSLIILLCLLTISFVLVLIQLKTSKTDRLA